MATPSPPSPRATALIAGKPPYLLLCYPQDMLTALVATLTAALTVPVRVCVHARCSRYQRGAPLAGLKLPEYSENP